MCCPPTSGSSSNLAGEDISYTTTKNDDQHTIIQMLHEFDTGLDGIKFINEIAVNEIAMNDGVTNMPQQQQLTLLALQKLDSIYSMLQGATPEYKRDFQTLESLILPLLSKLIEPSNIEKKYIFWPDRKSAIDKQIQKILQITRKYTD